jgi:hypothetical protein
VMEIEAPLKPYESKKSKFCPSVSLFWVEEEMSDEDVIDEAL